MALCLHFLLCRLGPLVTAPPHHAKRSIAHRVGELLLFAAIGAFKIVRVLVRVLRRLYLPTGEIMISHNIICRLNYRYSTGKHW